MDFRDENLLAHRLKSGDGSAFDYLMDKYYRPLCAYAYTLGHDHSQAEDIVQNVFVSVWVNQKKINPHYSLKNYLYKSVYNEFIDQYRNAKQVVRLEKKYLEAVDQVAEHNYEELDDLIRLVNSEIDKLPSKCKRIFLLNKKEGLTHVEISEYLGISIKTVEGHITRAFKILGQKLGSKIKPILFLLFDFRLKIDALNSQ